MAKKNSKDGDTKKKDTPKKKESKKIDYQKMLDEQTDKVLKSRMEAEFKSKGLI